VASSEESQFNERQNPSEILCTPVIQTAGIAARGAAIAGKSDFLADLALEASRLADAFARAQSLRGGMGPGQYRDSSETVALPAMGSDRTR
jgi:hypothetical protein